MMNYFHDLEFDREFREFNFCPIRELSLKPGDGPSQSDLYELAYAIRTGHDVVDEFASALEWTLKEEAFNSFQSFHRYPIGYHDWFYAKLEQFLSILLYEKLVFCERDNLSAKDKSGSDRSRDKGKEILTAIPAIVDPRDLVSAFSPSECAQIEWYGLVKELSAMEGDRNEAVRQFLRERGELRRAIEAKVAQPQKSLLEAADAGVGQKTRHRSRRSGVAIRDSIIVAGTDQGLDRLAICKTLDDKGILTTGKMRKAQCLRWTVAWANPDLRNNVQQIFSKTLSRRKPVKP